jgi:hypothetical protein
MPSFGGVASQKQNTAGKAEPFRTSSGIGVNPTNR